MSIVIFRVGLQGKPKRCDGQFSDEPVGSGERLCCEPLCLLANSSSAVRVFSGITTLLPVSSTGGEAPPPGSEDRLHPDRGPVG